MSSYNIALNFEDGVTRFVTCKAGEKVLDAAFRAKINLPMDCSDGVCGTCKCRAEIGSYDLGDDYIDDALSEDEKDSGLVLTCQMVPESDCVIAVPASSTACKTEQSRFTATVSKVEPHNDAAILLELDVDTTAPVFLPGQYVNIDVPGSGQHRSYSFSSAPGQSKVSFLIKKIPGGVMSTWPRIRTGRQQSGADWTAWQFLSARGGAAVAVSRWRHRPGAVPVDAGSAGAHEFAA